MAKKFEDCRWSSAKRSGRDASQVQKRFSTRPPLRAQNPGMATAGSLCVDFVGVGMAFTYANENPKLKAAYSFYGAPPEVARASEEHSMSSLCFYGENDGG